MVEFSARLNGGWGTPGSESLPRLVTHSQPRRPSPALAVHDCRKWKVQPGKWWSAIAEARMGVVELPSILRLYHFASSAIIASITPPLLSGRLPTLWSLSLSLFPVSISGALRQSALHAVSPASANQRRLSPGYVSNEMYQISLPSSYSLIGCRSSLSGGSGRVSVGKSANDQGRCIPHEPS